jgi:predicted NAD/FAD-binding protein
MRIAIVGTGIAGNAAAYLLAGTHSLTVYERELRPGGHSHTVEIDHSGARLAVDLGFIVYNPLNYPNLTALFERLDVPTQTADMGFSVSLDGGRYEWAGRDSRIFDGLFAQRSNLLSPRHLRMLLEILRFQKAAKADIAAARFDGLTLGAWLTARGFSEHLRDRYVVPMGAAIWSMPTARMLDFPAETFLRFCDNHKLLEWHRPTWRTVTGGSRVYVQKLQSSFRDRIRLGAAVTRIERSASGVVIDDSLGHSEQYDAVILAAHSDQALAMLAEPTPAEQEILGSISYRANSVFLHCDPALMPRRRAAWTSWNYLGSARPTAETDVALTYWMNSLQRLDPTRDVFVSLNPPFEPRPDRVFSRHEVWHPQYDGRAVAAQRRLHEIQGRNRTYYCGAWTGFGFHEDGLVSAMVVAESLGARIPWRSAEEPLLEAAE